MPISSWRKRKCCKCGRVVEVLVGDNLTGWDLLPFVCDNCRRDERESSDNKARPKIKLF